MHGVFIKISIILQDLTYKSNIIVFPQLHIKEKLKKLDASQKAFPQKQFNSF